MKIAIPAQGDNQYAKTSARFARCSHFVIYDSTSLTFYAIENSAIKAQSGAGIEAVKQLASEDVTVVIAPHLGPKALDALDALSIKPYQYDGQPLVREVLYKYFEKDVKELHYATQTHV